MLLTICQPQNNPYNYFSNNDKYHQGRGLILNTNIDPSINPFVHTYDQI